MGELKKNIYVIGSPEVDIMIGKKLPNILKVKKKYKINFSFYSIILLHPDVNEDANDGEDNLCKAEAHGNNVTDLHHSS